MTMIEAESQSVTELRAEGWTLLPNRLDESLLHDLQATFGRLLESHSRRAEVNRGASRYQMYLPWEPPFDRVDWIARPDVLEVVGAVLGSDAALVYLASDTPLPGSDFQRVHPDTRLLFPGDHTPLPCYGLVLNVPLVDCTPENGSLEFWPRTHHLLRDPTQEEQAAGPDGLESRRANMPAGSLLLRDLRMWHRGTPNRSNAPRPHLAVVYVPAWYRFEQEPPRIPRETYHALPNEMQRLLRFATLVD